MSVAVEAAAQKLSDQVVGAGTSLLSGVVSARGYEEFLRAYEETIAPYNGWLSRNTFTLSARVAPDWAELVRKSGEEAHVVDEATHLWSVAVSAVLERLHAMLGKFDLEDLRKTI